MAKLTTWRSIEELLSRAKAAGVRVPPSWQAGYTAFTALARARGEADASASRTRGASASRSMIETVLKAALAGSTLPPFAEVAAPGLAEDADAEAAGVAAGIFRMAQDRALAEVADAIEGDAMRLTLEELAPAMSRLVEKVGQLVPKLDGLNVNDTRAILTSSESVRRAWEQLDECGTVYRALRAVARDVRAIAGWPTGRFSLLERPRKPAEEESQLDRLILDVEAGAWCPLLEQERELEAAERERIAAARPKPLVPSSVWSAGPGR